MIQNMNLAVLLTYIFFTQPDTVIYKYQNSNTSEILILKSNSTFEYQYKQNFLDISVNGYWSINKDSLVLNSAPQRDRLIVFEKRDTLSEDLYIFKVLNKKNEEIMYHLNLSDRSGQETYLKDQFGISEVDKSTIDLGSFSVKDTKGLTSPTYNLVGSKANYFEIFFETQRVFEAEIWIIINNELIPRTMSGNQGNYRLSLVQ